MQGVRHARCRELPGTLASGLGVESFPSIEQVLFVEQDSAWAGAADGTQAKPFTTVRDALVAAAALVPAPAADNRVLVFVYSGAYDEQALSGVPYVDVVGVDRDSVVLYSSVGDVLTDAAGNTTYRTLTFAGVTGKPVHVSAADPVEFVDCAFTTLWPIPAGADPHMALHFDDCGEVRLYDCTITATAGSKGWEDVWLSGGAAVLLKGTTYDGHYILVEDTAALSIEEGDYYSTYAADLISFASTGHLLVRHARIALGGSASACIKLSAQPDTCIVQDNYFDVGGQGTYSLASSLAVTGIVCEGNTMIGGGIHENISHLNPKKIVGSSGMKDWYYTTQEALNSCTYDYCVVELWKDETLVAAASGPGRTCTVDLNGFTLTRVAADVIAAGLSDVLTVRNGNIVGIITMTSDAICIVDEAVITGRVDISTGSFPGSLLTIRNSRIIADDTSAYSLRFTDSDTVVVVENSYLKGRTGSGGSPAVYWGNTQNTLLKIKNSTLVHGDGVSAPFGSAGGVANIDYAAHHWSCQTHPSTVIGPPTFTNKIAAAQEYATVDANVDWS